MSTSLYISTGALRAFQQKLDTNANNIANVNTTGYKRRDQSFSELLTNQINNQSRADQEVGRLTPNGLRVGYGSRTGLTKLNMEQGQLLETKNPFDLMINGSGFFQVSYPSSTEGGAREIRFTRDGNFHLSPDPNQPGSYHLVNANGGLLLDQNGTPIRLNENNEVQIGANGQILLKNKNGLGDTYTSAQRVGLVEIQNPSLLQNLGGNEYSINTGALTPGANLANFVRNLTQDESQVTSGFLEGSNVDLGREMTDLITTQRGFQMNARAVSFADEMLGIANNIVK
ncbi:MAG: flagellar hook-basal body protein [Bacillales bacterium]|jgi:flagellar basal-body rod protein FlgG|nr:flagellar hook-basal body protein [Bacillales bacterium]